MNGPSRLSLLRAAASQSYQQAALRLRTVAFLGRAMLASAADLLPADRVRQGAKRLARLMPEVGVMVTDWHLSVMVGKRQRGFTVGPHFLSYDEDNDIARQIVSPPTGYRAPLSNFNMEWSSHKGIVHLFSPEVHIHGAEEGVIEGTTTGGNENEGKTLIHNGCGGN